MISNQWHVFLYNLGLTFFEFRRNTTFDKNLDELALDEISLDELGINPKMYTCADYFCLLSNNSVSSPYLPT